PATDAARKLRHFAKAAGELAKGQPNLLLGGSASPATPKSGKRPEQAGRLRRPARSLSSGSGLWCAELRLPLGGLGVVPLPGLGRVPGCVEIHDRLHAVASVRVRLTAYLDPNWVCFEQVGFRSLELLEPGSGHAQPPQQDGEETFAGWACGLAGEGF